MAPKKRKQPERAPDRASFMTSWSIEYIDQINSRPNCQWQVAHPHVNALSAHLPDPNPNHRLHIKDVSINFPCAQPGDLVVCTLNDGFVADDGAFVLPNSTYSFQIPESHQVHPDGTVAMSCKIPVNSWHKRKNPNCPDSSLAWVYTEYAKNARVVSVAVYAALPGVERVMELFTI